jgi:hydrogenase maturation protease
VGNPIRQDDAVGLVVVSLLRKKFGGSPRPWLKIHRASSDPERLLSKFSSKAERMIVFDAVDAGRPPGTIVCANLADTKFGFFATHNVPLRIIPGVAERLEAVTVVGVQPKSIDVVEGLTETVSEASERLVGSCEAIIGGTGND